MNGDNAETIYLIVGIISTFIWFLTNKFKEEKYIGYLNAISGVIAFMIFVTAFILLLAHIYDSVFPPSGSSVGNDPYCEPDPLFGGC